MTSAIAEDGHNGTGNAIAKQKRISTAARKEQNRLAARAYHGAGQRQKDRAPRSPRGRSLKSRPQSRNDQHKENTGRQKDCRAGTEPLSRGHSNTNGIDANVDSLNRDDPYSHTSLLGLDMSNMDHDLQATFGLCLGEPTWPPPSLNSCISQSDGSSEALLVNSSADLDMTTGQLIPTLSRDLAIPFSLPYSYRDYIQPSRMATVMAFMSNARCIGLDVEDLMTSCVKCMSPFYRPIAPSDDPKALVVAAAMPSTPAHLHPTLPQILFPHHAYLDLVPFATIRARAISWLTREPPLFDAHDLKMDMIEGGLLYWRPANWRGKVDLNCWEVAPWFRRKWRMLIDGDDGEICRQSKWWQNVRDNREKMSL